MAKRPPHPLETTIIARLKRLGVLNENGEPNEAYKGQPPILLLGGQAFRTLQDHIAGLRRFKPAHFDLTKPPSGKKLSPLGCSKLWVVEDFPGWAVIDIYGYTEPKRKPTVEEIFGRGDD